MQFNCSVIKTKFIRYSKHSISVFFLTIKIYNKNSNCIGIYSDLVGIYMVDIIQQIKAILR